MKRNLVLLPVGLCKYVDNDGTHQETFKTTIDRNGLVAIDQICIPNEQVQETLAGNGVEWKLEACWPSACTIFVIDPNDITLIKLHWSNHGIIFQESA
jgi:hypothetical protein